MKFSTSLILSIFLLFVASCSKKVDDPLIIPPGFDDITLEKQDDKQNNEEIEKLKKNLAL